jgi:CBS-domain-containing membrane protein
VARTNLQDAQDLLVADVIHKRFSALPADTTIGQVREWFAASSHRRLAVIADARRYVGALTRDDLAAGVDVGRRAAELARHDPTVAPDAPARTGHKLALTTDARRVPVVDHEGVLIGVVGVTDDLAGFCGTS